MRENPYFGTIYAVSDEINLSLFTKIWGGVNVYCSKIENFKFGCLYT